ncbi:hypothetical protein [Lysobacter gummosus]|uniref:hypothetical protein n=1 Tax=Lysobacter gummosus TaxID=262324 RepID=UPI003645AF80
MDGHEVPASRYRAANRTILAAPLRALPPRLRLREGLEPRCFCLSSPRRHQGDWGFRRSDRKASELKPLLQKTPGRARGKTRRVAGSGAIGVGSRGRRRSTRMTAAARAKPGAATADGSGPCGLSRDFRARPVRNRRRAGCTACVAASSEDGPHARERHQCC